MSAHAKCIPYVDMIDISFQVNMLESSAVFRKLSVSIIFKEPLPVKIVANGQSNAFIAKWLQKNLTEKPELAFFTSVINIPPRTFRNHFFQSHLCYMF